MNRINVIVKVKSSTELITLILFHKIYSTPDGIVNYWSTGNDSNYRLEIIIDERDSAVSPKKITKDMEIITDEWEIADQVTYKFHEKRIFEFQKKLIRN